MKKIADRNQHWVRLYTEEHMPCSRIAEQYAVTRCRVWQVLQAAGVDTSKGKGAHVETQCGFCGRKLSRMRCRWRRGRRSFCDRECFHATLEERAGRYEAIMLREYLRALGVELPRSVIVHHVDGRNSNDDLENLIVFKNHADHVKWHEGDRDGVEPVWRGDE